MVKMNIFDLSLPLFPTTIHGQPGEFVKDISGVRACPTLERCRSCGLAVVA